jgi:hypothetical protein
MLPQQALLKKINWLKWKSQKNKLVKAMLANKTANQFRSRRRAAVVTADRYSSQDGLT